MSKIIEITTFKQLIELSSMAGGSVQGYSLPIGDKEDKEMIKREELVTEQKLRSYIREKIKKTLKKDSTQQLNEEAALRKIIRSVIAEADVSDIHPRS